MRVLIVEDDAYGFLFEGQQPLCAALPERTFYLTSMSKSLVPGLRVGLPRHAILVSFSHTHTGPALSLEGPPETVAYTKGLQDKLVNHIAGSLALSLSR